MSAKVLARRLQTLVPDAARAASSRPSPLIPSSGARRASLPTASGSVAPLTIHLALRQPSAHGASAYSPAVDRISRSLSASERAVLEAIKRAGALTRDEDVLAVALWRLADHLDVDAAGTFDLPYRNSMSHLRMRLA